MVTSLFSISHVRVINKYKSCFAFIGRILGTFHNRGIFYINEACYTGFTQNSDSFKGACYSV